MRHCLTWLYLALLDTWLMLSEPSKCILFTRPSAWMTHENGSQYSARQDQTVLMNIYLSLHYNRAGTSGLQFIDGIYRVTVWESPASDSDGVLVGNPPTPVTGVVVTVKCKEDDGTPLADNSVPTYSILEGGDDLFSIDAMTGEFSVVDQPFDYEAKQWYSVSIFCYLNSSMNGTGTVNVTIGPVNEYLPTFDDLGGSKTITIPETTPLGTRIAAADASIGPLLNYTATDRDRGSDGRIQYIFSDDNDDRIQQFFELEATSGTLTLRAHLDIDDLPSPFERLEVLITACNKNVTISFCEIIALTIFVTAANDNLPMFSKPLYTASVNESALNGTAVLEVECEDDDNGQGAVQGITFQADTSNSTTTAFDLSPSGSLLLRSGLDYESTAKYQFILVCFDVDNNVTAEVIVNVLPVNDNLPQFTQEQYEFSVDRTDPSPSDTIIGVIEASDADTGEAGTTVTYSIDSSSHFDIDPETGEITLKGYLSVNDGVTFDFDVVATDGEHQTRARVRVTATGLLSVPEWIYVGLAGAGVLVILVVVGIIVFYCFIKAARVRIVERYREDRMTLSGSETEDIDMQHGFLPMYPPPHPAMLLPHDGRMSMVGQPLYPGEQEEEEEEEEEFSEHSGTVGTLEGSQYRMTPGPVLQEVVDYFHEGDKKLLDKKGSKK